MEIKVNREIRQYTESLFLGLSLRQLIFLPWPSLWLWWYIFCLAAL